MLIVLEVKIYPDRVEPFCKFIGTAEENSDAYRMAFLRQFEIASRFAKTLRREDVTSRKVRPYMVDALFGGIAPDYTPGDFKPLVRIYEDLFQTYGGERDSPTYVSVIPT